ncbi:MAG: response regulator [Bacilli bacterium]
MTNLYFPVASLMITLFLNIIFYTKKNVNNYETKIFKNLIVLNLFESLFSCTIIFLGYKHAPLGLLELLNRIDYICVLFWVWFLFVYIYKNALNTVIEKKKIIKISLIFNVIASMLILFGDIRLLNEGDIMNSFGVPINVLYISCLIYIIVIFLIIIFKNQNLKDVKNVPIYTLLMLCFSMLIIRKVDPGLLLTSFFISFINLIMYHTIENPDVKMVNELKLAKDNADKANRAKSDFLSSMSHEIRTPLNAIVGFSEIIETETKIESCKEDAKDIVTASHTLLEIVNGILDISKIEANKMEIVNKNFDLKYELTVVSKLMNTRIGDKPLKLITTFAEDIPNILYGDIGKVKQIITNILTNAIKYTEKGEINFSVNCINNKDNSDLVINVSDTGRGIKPEKMNSLFTKFNRLDEDKNTTLEGTGLGLAITKSLVEMMGGKIVVNSTYGKGSSFTIYLSQKIVSKDETLEKKNIALNDSSYKNSNVLIVDDNILNLKVADKLLKRYNINTKISETGKECIKIIKSGETFDMILLDDMMPEMDGKEVLIELKKIPNFNIPVVALTANVMSGIKEKYIKLGFNDYLAKPIESIELSNLLNKYLNRKQEIKYKDFSNKKILIVDDNKLNIKIARNFLKSYNFTIEESISGIDAIEKIRNNKYDLIFMDYMMPKMDGIETLNKLKEIKDFDTSVVVITAEVNEDSKEKFIKAGFKEYIPKPINKKELDLIINKLIK